MPINVVCPGCYTRFQVHEKFAGKKGPCPKCQVVIEIPKEQIVIHAPDEFVSGGKTVKGRAILKPLTRLNTDFKVRDMLLGGIGFCAVFVIAAILGLPSLGLGPGLRNIIGMAGLFAIAVPLVFFGQRVLKDADDLMEISQGDILKKCAICAGAYAALWICFEFLAKYMQADSVFIWVYWIPFAIFSMIVAHVVFEFDFGRVLLHYFAFFVPVILLRGLLGLGWIWHVVAAVNSGTGHGPPPPPPGLGR